MFGFGVSFFPHTCCSIRVCVYVQNMAWKRERGKDEGRIELDHKGKMFAMKDDDGLKFESSLEKSLQIFKFSLFLNFFFFFSSIPSICFMLVLWMDLMLNTLNCFLFL